MPQSRLGAWATHWIRRDEHLDKVRLRESSICGFGDGEVSQCRSMKRSRAAAHQQESRRGSSVEHDHRRTRSSLIPSGAVGSSPLRSSAMTSRMRFSGGRPAWRPQRRHTKRVSWSGCGIGSGVKSRNEAQTGRIKPPAPTHHNAVQRHTDREHVRLETVWCLLENLRMNRVVPSVHCHHRGKKEADTVHIVGQKMF